MQSFSLPRPNGQAATRIITGQYIARAVHYPKSIRARDAAQWIRGLVAVTPTSKLAAEVFGVSVASVAAARARLAIWERDRAKRHTVALSDDQIERIVAEVGPERVMRALERITQPRLPFSVAAE